VPKAVLFQAVLVVIAVAAFTLAWFAARILREAAARWLIRHGVSGEAVVLGRRVVYIGLLFAGALLALSIALYSSNVTLAAIVVATIIASFGVQDVLKNYVSGYYLLLEGNIRPGDSVEFDGKAGVVEDIKLRVSLLRRQDGALVVVPNAELFNSPVTVLPKATSARPAPPGRAPRIPPIRGRTPPGAAS
jgi:small conductance mechanosensitive channel